jgi:hypothetical protein
MAIRHVQPPGQGCLDPLLVNRSSKELEISVHLSAAWTEGVSKLRERIITEKCSLDDMALIVTSRSSRHKAKGATPRKSVAPFKQCKLQRRPAGCLCFLPPCFCRCRYFGFSCRTHFPLGLCQCLCWLFGFRFSSLLRPSHFLSRSHSCPGLCTDLPPTVLRCLGCFSGGRRLDFASENFVQLILQLQDSLLQVGCLA